MDKHIVTLALVIVSFISGFFVAGRFAEKPVIKGHMMPDGSYMEGDMMHGSMDMMTQALENASEGEFDGVFLREMIVHHEGAVDMARMVLTRSNNETLKSFAQQIIGAQTTEIEQMKVWEMERK